MKDFKLNYAQKRTLIIGGFRYALGRRTYVVSDTVDILLTNWDNFSDHDKQLFAREIEHAIERGLAGMDMDVRQWQKILARFESERTKLDSK